MATLTALSEIFFKNRMSINLTFFNQLLWSLNMEWAVKCIEVWKHGELTSGKQDSKYELEALFVSIDNLWKSIVNYCRSLFISIC